VAALRALKGKEGVSRRRGGGWWWQVYMYSVQQVTIDTWLVVSAKPCPGERGAQPLRPF